MPQFNNLDGLKKYLQAKINETLKEDVAAAVRETEQAQIKKVVYDATKPRGYERRGYNGGLIDDDNIETTLISDGVLSIKNVTPPNMGYESSIGLDADLPALIEYGDGYDGMEYTYSRSDGTDYEYKNPRPFTEATKEELKTNKQHIKALREGLKRRGL